MAAPRRDEHGSRCSCRLLADAVGCSAKAIRFTYCQAVLMKHWAIECNHNCHDEPAAPVRSVPWHDVGPIDPIKAILIRNE